jgi:peptidoglycan-associated lipoprotein
MRRTTAPEHGRSCHVIVNEVTMRLLLIFAAVLLLAAGCANTRTDGPELAPSRQAHLGGNTGWSVPPGQREARDPQAGDKASAAVRDTLDEAARAEEERRQREEAAREARERLHAGAQPELDSRATPPQERVPPLVPAFPARIEEDRVSTLRTVHFGFDKDDLTPAARALLDENARWLKANPEVAVRIGGHTDARGTPEYNLALGERRAKRVRNYLIEQGVPADNLVTVSYGEEMPIAQGENEGAWAQNRRAEFVRADGRQNYGAANRPSSG